MRDRKEGFLAATKEEFCELYDQQEEYRTERRRREPLRRKVIQLEDSDSSDNELGISSNYHITPKKKTMAEDEDELTCHIQKMNSDLQSFKTQLSPKDLQTKMNYDYSPNTRSTGSNNTDDVNYKELFLQQNIINYDDIIKLIVIGETAVGKSLFISKLNYPPVHSGLYTPTRTFEITKTLFNVSMTKTIKLELWDTNMSIINTDLIKTYYKLSNGFVIICNFALMTDCSFIQKQIDMIQTCTTNPNIFLIINDFDEKSSDVSCKYEHLHSQIQHLTDKYFITKKQCNLKQLNEEDSDFVEYIESLLLKKNPDVYKKALWARRVRTSESIDDSSDQGTLTLTKKTSSIIQSKVNEMFDELNLNH